MAKKKQTTKKKKKTRTAASTTNGNPPTTVADTATTTATTMSSSKKSNRDVTTRRQGGVHNLYTPKGCGLCFFKFRQQMRISSLRRQREKRKEQFGIDYSRLILEPALPLYKRRCLRQAIEDLEDIDDEIEACYNSIDNRVIELENEPRQRKKKTKEKEPRNIQRKTQGKLPKRVSQRQLMNNKSKKSARQTDSSHGIADFDDDDDAAKPLSAVNLDLLPKEFVGPDVGKWTSCVWKYEEYKTTPGWKAETEGQVDQVHGKSIQRAIEKFKTHRKLFVALLYPTEMLNWPKVDQQYTLIYRDGTTGLKPKKITKKGQLTFLMHKYQPLPSFDNDLLPKDFRDKYTDSMKYNGKKLVTKSNPPLMPGRGMSLIDDPTLKIIGTVNPSDIAQGQCGNCWLLSGIASLAEFDGAIRRLFRNTKDLDKMPYVDGRPNLYTITLWDLPTWKEVDIVVDERLPVRADGSGRLFGAKPSSDGELWVCYLEKALAAHCGGWDRIDGGQCTHAWALLTGCKEQYIIQRSMATPDEFCCTARFNTELQEWAHHDNSPSVGRQGTWEVPWPEVGGGGTGTLDEDELFVRMCAWTDQNYLVGASTKGASDENTTDGIVDNHAYSVIDCVNNVAGTDIDLILVRNPWGRGEIEDGRFGSYGSGWKEYPEIEEELEPIHDSDDGVFWVTKEEFFEYYETVYLGASDLTRFLKDGMKMSQHSKRNSKHNSRHTKLSKQSNHSTGLDSIDSFVQEEDDDEEEGVTGSQPNGSKHSEPSEQSENSSDYNNHDTRYDNHGNGGEHQEEKEDDNDDAVVGDGDDDDDDDGGGGGGDDEVEEKEYHDFDVSSEDYTGGDESTFSIEDEVEIPQDNHRKQKLKRQRSDSSDDKFIARLDTSYDEAASAVSEGFDLLTSINSMD